MITNTLEIKLTCDVKDEDEARGKINEILEAFNDMNNLAVESKFKGKRDTAFQLRYGRSADCYGF